MIDLEKARLLATDLRRHPTVALADEAARVIRELAAVVEEWRMSGEMMFGKRSTLPETIERRALAARQRGDA